MTSSLVAIVTATSKEPFVFIRRSELLVCICLALDHLDLNPRANSATDEPSFSVMYGQLCHRLAHMTVQMADKAGSPVTFRRLLLNRCQKEFDRKQEKRSIGLAKLIGELFKLKMLTVAIIFSCTFQLLKKQDEVSLEQLCTLLATVGKELFIPRETPKMSKQPQLDETIQLRPQGLALWARGCRGWTPAGNSETRDFKTAGPKPDSVLQSAPLSQLSTPPTRPRHDSAGKKTDIKQRHSETSE
uniref:MIF4G domain-containing protein n=1 Tax=Salarias fasciatus TaxID=181472 RepID=A0A672GJG3_SALFA